MLTASMLLCLLASSSVVKWQVEAWKWNPSECWVAAPSAAWLALLFCTSAAWKAGSPAKATLPNDLVDCGLCTGDYATSYSTAARHKQRMKERSANVTAFVQDPWLHANDLSNDNSMQNCQGSIISARRRVTSFFPGKQLSSSQQASKFYQIFALLCGLWTVDYSL